MILLLLGAPGTGKTTVCQTLTAQYGVPHFEMSWMPEFLRMNGQDIPYAQDEQIAVGALLAVAKVYTEAGHRVVVVSDFRNEVIPLVLEQLRGTPSQIVRLYSSSDTVLAERVTDPSRPSGFRDVDAAQQANAALLALDFDTSIDLDIATMPLHEVVKSLERAVIRLNSAG